MNEKKSNDYLLKTYQGTVTRNEVSSTRGFFVDYIVFVWFFIIDFSFFFKDPKEELLEEKLFKIFLNEKKEKFNEILSKTLVGTSSGLN